MPDDRLARGPNDVRLRQFLPASPRDLGDFGGEALHVLGFLHQERLRDQQREVGVDVAGGLDALVESALNGLPQCVAGRLEDDAAAYDLGVIGQIGAWKDIQIPLRVILRAWSDALFRHGKSVPFRFRVGTWPAEASTSALRQSASDTSHCNCSSRFILTRTRCGKRRHTGFGLQAKSQGWIGADLDLRAGGFSAIRKREFSVVRFRVARDSPRTSTTLELHRGIIGLDQPACDWRTSMITRREFGTGFVVGALATSVGSVATAQQRPWKNTLMHVGGDYHSIFGGDITSKQNLEYNLRHGVRYLTAEIKNRPGKGWDSDQLKRMKDNCDRYGVVLEAFRMDSDYITLPNGAERDREIETVAGNIRKSAQIGVRIVTYHWELIPFRRN